MATRFAVSKSIWSLSPAIVPRPISFPITEFGLSPSLSANALTFTVSGISILDSLLAFIFLSCLLLFFDLFFLFFFFLFFFTGLSSSSSSLRFLGSIFFSLFFSFFALGFSTFSSLISSCSLFSSVRYSFINLRSSPLIIDI